MLPQAEAYSGLLLLMGKESFLGHRPRKPLSPPPPSHLATFSRISCDGYKADVWFLMSWLSQYASVGYYFISVGFEMGNSYDSTGSELECKAEGSDLQTPSKHKS